MQGWMGEGGLVWWVSGFIIMDQINAENNEKGVWMEWMNAFSESVNGGMDSRVVCTKELNGQIN